MRQRFFSFLLALTLLPAADPAWAMGRRPKETPASSSQVLLRLSDCYDLALRRSETVAMQQEEIKRTGATFLRALGEAVGDINYVVTNSFQEPQNDVLGGADTGSVGGTFNSEERRERKFVLTQPLFQGFKSIGTLTGAGSLRKQRGQEARRARELLFIDVVKAFYGLLKFEKDLETIQGINQLYEERVMDLEEREQIGRSRASEVFSAKAQMKLLEAELARAEGNLRIGRELMSYFVGVEPERIKLQEETTNDDPGEMPDLEDIIEHRSDVQAQRHAMKSAWRSVIVAQSDFWPHADLEVKQYDHREGFQSSIDWDALVTLDIPIFTGGTTAGEFKDAWVDWKKAKLAYSLSKRQAELEIKESFQNWQTSMREHKALEAAVKAAQENFRLQKEDYSRSLVNNLEVLSALQSFFETSKEANRVYYGMKQSYWRLQTAMGNVGETA